MHGKKYKLTNISYIPIFKLQAVKAMITIGEAKTIFDAKGVFDKILIEGLEVDSWQKKIMSEYFIFSEEEIMSKEEKEVLIANKELEEEVAIADAWYNKLSDTEKNYIKILGRRDFNPAIG